MYKVHIIGADLYTDSNIDSFVSITNIQALSGFQCIILNVKW